MRESQWSLLIIYCPDLRLQLLVICLELSLFLYAKFQPSSVDTELLVLCSLP